MKCLLCGTDGPDDLHLADAQGWNWFTGYFDSTCYFCPADAMSRAFHQLLDLSRQRPPDWPDTQHWSSAEAARRFRQEPP